MKLLAVFLVAIFCISHIEAKPVPDPGLLDWFTNTVGSISNKISQFRSGLLDKFNSFRNGVADYFKAAKQKLKDTYNAVKETLTNIRDQAVKTIFAKIEEYLEAGNEKLNELSENADKKFAEYTDKAEKLIFEISSGIKTFQTNMEKKIESKENKEEGQKILQAFVEETTKKVNECYENTIEPIKGLYEVSKNTLNKGYGLFTTITYQIGECASNRDAKECSANLLEQGKLFFDFITTDVLELNRKLVNTGFDEVTGAVCIGKTRLSVEESKKTVEKQIDELQ